jgi:hypothetical protein
MNRKNNCSLQVSGSRLQVPGTVISSQSGRHSFGQLSNLKPETCNLRPATGFARLLTLICAMSIGIAATAQDFTIKRVEMEGDLVNIYYDLMDTTARRTYTVNLFSSRDNYITALEKVTGDLGLEVKPGPNRKISWNTRGELGDAFEGEVSLEVRGRLYIPFVRLDGQYETMKRTKSYEMTWTGGTQQNILNFDLYKDGEKITSFPNIANVGHYTLVLPSSVKPGKGYHFQITDTKNKDQIVNTPPFVVKAKYPLILKAVPVVLVGGLVYWLVSRQPEAEKIDEAPGPPGG